jgi:hypothetical protein
MDGHRKSAYDAHHRAEAFILPQLGDIEVSALNDGTDPQVAYRAGTGPGAHALAQEWEATVPTARQGRRQHSPPAGIRQSEPDAAQGGAQRGLARWPHAKRRRLAAGAPLPRRGRGF